MTAVISAPVPQKRPPNVPRDWWYRATWRARQLAIAKASAAEREAKERARRAAEAKRAAELEAIAAAFHTRKPNGRHVPKEKRVEQVELLLHTHSPAQIVLALDIRAHSIAAAMRRANRPDLARRFENLRSIQEGATCPDCGNPIAYNSKRCRPCANASRTTRRPTERTAR